jgi:hypothetical protein
MIEGFDEAIYKFFTQRTICQNCLLVLLALLSDSVDYIVLAGKSLKGIGSACQLVHALYGGAKKCPDGCSLAADLLLLSHSSVSASYQKSR